MTVKPSTAPSRSLRQKAASGDVETDRDRWASWIKTLRRYQLDSLVGWLIEAGRPFGFLSAQIMYMAVPFVGGTAARVGQLLESDEESRDFARLLASDMGSGGEQAGGRAA